MSREPMSQLIEYRLFDEQTMSRIVSANGKSTTKYFIEEDKILHEIVKLQSFKDLGVIFDYKLNFGEHKGKNQ